MTRDITNNKNLALDVVKPPARTEVEAHRRWLNRMESEVRLLPNYGRKIEVKYDTTIS